MNRINPLDAGVAEIFAAERLAMVEVIALGAAGDVYGPPGGEGFNVSYDGHTAVLSLQRFGEHETWLLTGWDDVVPGDARAGNATSAYAPDPSGMRDQVGADSDSSVANRDAAASNRLPSFDSIAAAAASPACSMRDCRHGGGYSDSGTAKENPPRGRAWMDDRAMSRCGAASANRLIGGL